MVTRCTATNAAGEPCGAQAWHDGLCPWHHPDRAEEMTEARRRGGKAKANRARAKKEMANAAMTAPEISGVLAVTIKAVLAGSKTPGVGQAIAALSRAALEAGKASDLETRMEEIERRLGAKVS